MGQPIVTKKHLQTVLCIGAILGSGLWIYLSSSPRGSKIDLDPYRALGEVAAEETSRLLPQKGSVVIIARENPSGEDVVAAAQLKALNGALAKVGFKVAATETYSVPRMDLFARGTVPHDRFLQMLQAHPNTAAFVLCAALPPLDPSELDRVKQSGAKLVSICGFRPGDEALLKSRVLSLAIVPRIGSPPEGLKPAPGLRGVFDRSYKILSGDNPSGDPR